MTAAQYFTSADEHQGYPKTRECLKQSSADELAKEYHSNLRDCFGGNLFCGNARRYFNLVVDELLRRGITQLPNIFGPITVKHWTDLGKYGL